jgi:hypothetical protein
MPIAIKNDTKVVTVSRIDSEPGSVETNHLLREPNVTDDLDQRREQSQRSPTPTTEPLLRSASHLLFWRHTRRAFVAAAVVAVLVFIGAMRYAAKAIPRIAAFGADAASAKAQ